MKKAILCLGIALIIIGGVVHLLDARDAYGEAVYKGILFYVNFVFSLIAVWGIFKNKLWAWKLGFVISVLSIMLYCLSRSVGLPLIPAEPDAWLEPLGVISLLAEGLFIFVFIKNKKCILS